MENKAIYESINAITADLVKAGGISKDRQNQQQHYNFRGIDDVLNELAPLLVKHRVVILPKVIERHKDVRETQKGNALYYTVVDCEFSFVSSVDGSREVVRIPGEAMDSADKSTNKAISAAMKYACIMTFCIPTEVDDADATTPEETKTGAEAAKTEPKNGKEAQTEKPEPLTATGPLGPGIQIPSKKKLDFAPGSRSFPLLLKWAQDQGLYQLGDKSAVHRLENILLGANIRLFEDEKLESYKGIVKEHYLVKEAGEEK